MTNLTSEEISSNKPQRVTEVPDPKLNEIFSDSEDRVDSLIRHLPELSLKQKVHALLLLDDDEFSDFQECRKGGAKVQLSVLQNQIPGQVDKKDYIQAVSRLKDAVPRYEVEAEIRRRQKGKYPAEWDLDLEEDKRFKPNDGLLRLKQGKRLTYEQAVEFTKFENVRSWYRNVFFPYVTRFKDPLPLTMSTLVELFKQQQSTIFDPHKPGTEIAIDDLLTVLDFYLYEKEPDNLENCQVHEKVRFLTGIVNDLEKALSDN